MAAPLRIPARTGGRLSAGRARSRSTESRILSSSGFPPTPSGWPATTSRSSSSMPNPVRSWSGRSANSAANGPIRLRSRSMASTSSKKMPVARSATRSPAGPSNMRSARKMVMTRIVLVRHGHVDWIAPERFRGRAELALSDLGRRQAQALANYIAKTWGPDAIYTSPLGRCRDTGAAIAAPFKVEPRVADALCDIDYGEWQGLTREQAKERWPDEIELWFRAPHLAVIPGGETLPVLLSRAAAALRKILRVHNSGTVVLVGHDS